MDCKEQLSFTFNIGHCRKHRNKKDSQCGYILEINYTCLVIYNSSMEDRAEEELSKLSYKKELETILHR